jgi:hypothetical protein
MSMGSARPCHRLRVRPVIILALIVLAVAATLTGLRLVATHDRYVRDQRAAFTPPQRGRADHHDGATDTPTSVSMSWSGLDDYRLRRLLDGSAS